MRLRPDDAVDPKTGRAETGPARSLGIAGITSGTPVMTDSGWLDVAQVVEGDLIMTLEKGPQRVTSVRRRTFGANLHTFWPNGLVYVPDNALGPAEAYYLLPGQEVMLDPSLASAMFDDPAMLVPAAALEGIRGITRVMPIDLIEVLELRFAGEVTIECQGGTWLRCPGVSARLKTVPFRRRAAAGAA